MIDELFVLVSTAHDFMFGFIYSVLFCVILLKGINSKRSMGELKGVAKELLTEIKLIIKGIA